VEKLIGEDSVLRQFLNGWEKFNEGDVIASGRSNVTDQPNLSDIVHFRPYHPHGFVLGDHTWPQNTSNKSWTSTTNNVSYQILTHWCGILQFTPLKELDDPSAQPDKQWGRFWYQMSPPGLTCQILFALGLTALTDLFLMTIHGLKTCLKSQQPSILIRLAIKSSPADVGYYTKSILPLKN